MVGMCFVRIINIKNYYVMHNEIKEILKDILYWDTCPDKYKEIINKHLSSEPQKEVLNTSVVSKGEADLLNDYNEHLICKYELHTILENEVDEYLEII